MNRSAYLTTGLAIKALANITKADVALHDVENIPTGPTIFVINHFTRLETCLIPYHIYNHTGHPVWSLADSSLFQGGLGTFLDLVGAISTTDPKRDELIVRSLLAGEAHWIIFPEGSMVKTKQIVQGNKFMVTSVKGMRKPHTGAASLALRSELFRKYLLDKKEHDPAGAKGALDFLDLESLDQVVDSSTTLTPVNITYYPIRARENVLSNLAEKMVKDIPEAMVEEIMTEGTMLLSGVDIDIRFGKPLQLEPYLQRDHIVKQLEQQKLTGKFMSPTLRETMHDLAEEIMQCYMADIYKMTTVNHEHLFASLLRFFPGTRLLETQLRKRAFIAASKLGDMGSNEQFLHKSLQGNQAHLLTDDRYQKFDNFIKLALDKGIVTREGKEILVLDRTRLSASISVYKGRIENPIEIIANEVEPLSWLKKLIFSIGVQPDWLFRITMVRYMVKNEIARYKKEYAEEGREDDLERKSYGTPFLMPALNRKVGVVLIHSYLSAPEEMRELARYLRKKRFWVYSVRLPGHGTSSSGLATKTFMQWIEAVENGYLLMNEICDKVVVCGMSVGASLALDLCTRVSSVAGVVGICPPLRINDYSNQFMPSQDVWNRVVKKIRGEDEEQFVEFHADNPHINYRRNPFAGIQEVDRLLGQLEPRLKEISAPALIIQADNDPIINVKGGRKLYNKLGSPDKQYSLFNFDRHIIVNGDGAERVFRNVANFVKHIRDL